MSQHSVELLASLIGMLPPKPTVRNGSKAKRNAYNAETVARHRAAAKAAEEAGIVKPSAANIQQALADAALMLLAVGGPGAEQVRVVLRQVFSAHVGTPLTVEMHAKAGKLKPKLFKAK